MNSGSEFDDLYTPELDANYSFSNESDWHIFRRVYSGAHLPDRFSKQPLIQNQLDTTEAPHETNDTDAAINTSHRKRKRLKYRVGSDSSQNKLPFPNIGNLAKTRNVVVSTPDGTEWH